VYAVKVFKRSQRTLHSELELQKREFSLLHKLKHDNIVAVLQIEDEVRPLSLNGTHELRSEAIALQIVYWPIWLCLM